MKNMPEEISLYLARLEGNQRADGFLCLDYDNNIITSAGWVGNTDLTALDPSQNLVLSLPMLEGLLPANKKVPTVINNVHVDKNDYFDIHVFYAGYTVCVLFIDKTHSAKLLQQEQQIRLTDDFINDKKRQGGS